MIDFLRSRYCSEKSKRKLETQRTESEVTTIAHAAVANPELAKYLIWTTAHEKEGRIIWEVSSATIGSQLILRIDDATGEVLEITRRGIR